MNGQVSSLSVNGNPLLSQVLYEPFGPVSGWTSANKTNEARVYDQDGNLTMIAACRSSIGNSGTRCLECGAVTTRR